MKINVVLLCKLHINRWMQKKKTLTLTMHLQLEQRKHSYANFNSSKSLTFGAPVSVLFIYSYHTGLSAH